MVRKDVPISSSMEYVYWQPDPKKPELTLRKWQKDVLELVSRKCPPEEFIRLMIQTFFGENKEVIVVDKKDPGDGVSRLNDVYRDTNFDIKLSVKETPGRMLKAV